MSQLITSVGFCFVVESPAATMCPTLRAEGRHGLQDTLSETGDFTAIEGTKDALSGQWWLFQLSSYISPAISANHFNHETLRVADNRSTGDSCKSLFVSETPELLKVSRWPGKKR